MPAAGLVVERFPKRFAGMGGIGSRYLPSSIGRWNGSDGRARTEDLEAPVAAVLAQRDVDDPQPAPFKLHHSQRVVRVVWREGLGCVEGARHLERAAPPDDPEQHTACRVKGSPGS